jgi:hypothetical protein
MLSLAYQSLMSHMMNHHNNLQVNAKKSSFCALETKYLGFILTREGIKAQQQKVNAILQVALPCNTKQVQSFIGMLNHYKAMIPHCSHFLTLLIALTKMNIKFEWTMEHQQAFDSLENSLTCTVVHLQQCLQIPNQIHHYPKRKATCILFKETY